MDLRELTAYAKTKYGIDEQYQWPDYPGLSVLCHPETGKWMALLIRQWDSKTGGELEYCDLKCGKPDLSGRRLSYLSAPIRMKGALWTGISFTEATDPSLVFLLFDKAVAAGQPGGVTIVLEQKPVPFGKAWPATPLINAARTSRQTPASYERQTSQETSFSFDRQSAQETPLSFDRHTYQETFLSFDGHPARETPLSFTGRPARTLEPVPERIREMRRLYEYGRESDEARAKNFYRQGKAMADYEDEYPWTDKDFFVYYPTYHDLTTSQLRGYFSWRKKARQGHYDPIPISAACIYIYELLNGIGADTPLDILQKLKAFEEGFQSPDKSWDRVRSHLHRWMLDLSILSNLPPEAAQAYADPVLMAWDQALTALRSPTTHSDEAVFSAFVSLTGKKLAQSPVLTADPERGKHLFSEAWRRAAGNYKYKGRDLFTACFGTQPLRVWTPFFKAIYYWKCKPDNFIYHLTDVRTYVLEKGVFGMKAYESLYFDRELLKGFVHETDLLLRRYLKTGRYLKEKAANVWAAPYVQQVIEEDKRAILEASRPKISLNLAGLDKIRADALVTQASLLIEEEDWAQNLPGLSPDNLHTEPPQADVSSLSASVTQNTALTEYGQESTKADMGSLSDNTVREAILTGDHQVGPVDLSLVPAPALDDLDAKAPQADPAVFPAGAAPDGLHEKAPQADPAGLPAGAAPVLPLSALHCEILRTLLSGGNTKALISAHHLMPSIVADTVNEALFEEIGDTVLICEDDQLSILEDYLEDLANLLEDKR